MPSVIQATREKLIHKWNTFSGGSKTWDDVRKVRVVGKASIQYLYVVVFGKDPAGGDGKYVII